MKKIIETALPLSAINAKTANEHTGSSGNPANLHMWWGRSPEYSSLFALTASLIDASEDKEELLRRLERIESNCYTELGDKPKIFDPFSGFGGMPLAAQRLGISAVAGDLNPVAVMLTKAATEIPYKFANRSPINQFSLFNDYVGLTGFAEDVEYYGEWMLKEASKKLSSLYPNEPEGQASAWIWVRTVKCPNPACGCRMPLASSFVINGKSGQETWAEPIAKDGMIHFEIRRGKWPKEKGSNKYGNRAARFICPACGEITSDEYVKQQGISRNMGTQMMAVLVDTDCGRIYKEPSDAQIRAADVKIPDDLPQGEIPNNLKWFSPPGFGFKEYSDLFSARQLTMLTTFCDLLIDVQNKAASDALAAGMSHEGGSLSDGGTGALAYGQAISIYLSFVIDKMADRNTTFCSWNSSSGVARATFGRQAIPMVWNFAEGNPFSKFSGNFKSALKSVVDAVRNLPCGSEVTVYQGDAVTVEYPKNVLTCTELPYYKSIGYAHLSDFFYIWMRRSLKPIFPELFIQMVTPKDELSTVAQYYGKEAQECELQYESKMRTVLEKLFQAADQNYPTLLYFEFHKVDWDVMDNNSTKKSPFETIIQSLVDVGFATNALWPMRSEIQSDNADGFRILIVARKQYKTEQTTRRAFINTLKRELPDLLETAFCAGVDKYDKRMVAIGCGLSIATKYKRVINADGSSMTMHDALQIINQESKDYLQKEQERSGNGAEIKED